MSTPNARTLADRWNADGEFRLAARYWDGSFTMDATGEPLTFIVEGGVVRPASQEGGWAPYAPIETRAPAGVWAKILAPIPPRFFNDIIPARAFGLRVEGPDETFWQYYPAVRRAVYRPVRGGNALEDTVARLIQTVRLGVVAPGSRSRLSVSSRGSTG